MISDACKLSEPAADINIHTKKTQTRKIQESSGNPNRLLEETTADFRAGRVREGRQAQFKRERSLIQTEVKKKTEKIIL